MVLDMDVVGTKEAFCPSCDAVVEHAVLDVDRSACYCNGCGSSHVAR